MVSVDDNAKSSEGSFAEQGASVDAKKPALISNVRKARMARTITRERISTYMAIRTVYVFLFQCQI